MIASIGSPLCHPGSWTPYFPAWLQHEITLDDYAQSNIISGCIGFGGSFTEDYNTASDPTASGAGAPVGTGNQFGLADFLLGWGGSAGQQTGNHFFGTAVIPNEVAGRQTLTAAFGNDTYHASAKLTLNLGLRYEYQSPWSERHNRQSFFDPTAVDPLAAMAVGTPGGPTSAVLGAVGLVNSSARSSRYNLDETR